MFVMEKKALLGEYWEKSFANSRKGFLPLLVAERQQRKRALPPPGSFRPGWAFIARVQGPPHPGT